MVDFRYNWMNEIDSMQREMERLLQYLGASKPRMVQFDPEGWAPAVDVYETANEITVQIELAGIRHEEITIIIEGTTLIVKGQRRDTSTETRRTYYQMEIRRGIFQKSIAIPTSVDAERTKAAYKDGILEISLSKTASKQSNRVRIPI